MDLQQPEHPETVVEWLALTLVKDKKSSQMTSDEHLLIARSQLLAGILPFYRAIEQLPGSSFDKIKEIDSEFGGSGEERALYEAVLPELQDGAERNNMSAFKNMWQGAKEWSWRSSIPKDVRGRIDKYLELDDSKEDAESGFTHFCSEIFKLDPTLLDSLFPAMQDLPDTVKWETLSHTSRITLGDYYPRLVESIKELEQKLKLKTKRDAEGGESKKRNRADSPPDGAEGSAAGGQKKQKQKAADA